MTALPTPSSRPGSSLDSSLWARPVVVGTPETVAALDATLAASPGSPSPLGCLLVGVEGSLPSRVGTLDVLGALADLPARHERLAFTAAIVSLPGGMPAETLRLRARLRQLSITERFVPPLGETLARGPASPLPSLHPASLDLVELIGRTPFGVDRRAVARILEGKRVLITGAGGSIGSELCRIAATFRPAQIILMERSENALFEIDRQLSRRFPDVPRKALLHDVVDADATLRHLVALRPHTVFHAAAHKHVPLMEDHPAHAVTNNVFGTKSIADASLAVGVERFVMISSDKAVRPSSVMGATKRLAEMYVQSLNHAQAGRTSPRTSCTMVRFGNVLGSACSVLPIWSAQLAEGGPLTVTDPRMTRYFMTIHEAATLVIQAGAINAWTAAGDAGPTIFVLDMGEPVRILDLAQRFIRQHGFEPSLPLAPAATPAAGLRLTGRDIDIVFTGARPGEKLAEELAYDAEALNQTAYPGILALTASARAGDVTALVADLSAVRGVQDPEIVVRTIRRHVPEMRAEAR